MKRKLTLKVFTLTFLLFLVNRGNAQEPGEAYYFPGPVAAEGPDAIHARINNTGAFDFVSGTIEAWIRPDFDLGNGGYDDPFLFSIMDWDGRRWGIRIGKDYGGIGVVQGGSGWDTSWLNYKFEKGHWYHFAAVFNTDQTVSVYINGVAIGTSTVTIDLGVTGKPFKIGISNSWDVGNIFKGAVDEVRVWNVIRSEAEIKDNMNTTISPASAGLLAYYNFSQSATSDLIDLTSNGLNGGIGFWENNNLTKSSPNWVESYAMVVPQIQPVTNIAQTSFTANWQASTISTADGYIIDVATDASFNNIVSGYNGLNVGNVLTKQITGLAANTTYYYRIRADKASVAGQGAYSVTSSVTTENTLPLTFVKFITHKEGNAVNLRWETASEINNSHFNVLHSTYGIVWDTIAKIDAKELAYNTYTYQHKQPNTANNYYRLQQVDVNGDFTHSEIKVVDFRLSDDVVKIYPNPFAGTLNVEIASQFKEKSYTIYDVAGIKLKQGIMNEVYNNIDVSKLTQGIYFLQVNNEPLVKIIKQ